MNSGFHDAVAIAWRLAMVLHGKAKPIVLESYDPERGGEHRRLDDQQLRGFKNSIYRGSIKDAAMDLAARVIPDIGTLIQGSDDLQQLSVSYADSPLNEDHLTGLIDKISADAPKAGDRAPNANVIEQDGSSSTLFEHIYNSNGQSWGWTLLAFDSRKKDALPELIAASNAVKDWSFVHPRLVLGAAVPESGNPIALSDLDNEAHAAYSLGEPAVVLVRPDGHIAYRGKADAPEKLRAYCERIFAHC